MKRAIISTLFILLTYGLIIFSVTKALAEPVSCPAVIGDKETGAYRSTKSKSSRFECFSSQSAARRDGYSAPNRLTRENFTGWWRLRFLSKKDSCNKVTRKEGPVFFIQIRQRGLAAFADFCPSLDRMTGSRTSEGINVTLTKEVSELTNPLNCSNGVVEVTRHLEMTQMYNGSKGYDARMVEVRHCPEQSEATRSCTVEYTGVGFRETHSIWPAVSNNISEMLTGCQQALQTCVSCHPSFEDIPGF